MDFWTESRSSACWWYGDVPRLPGQCLLAAPTTGEAALDWEQMQTIITSLFFPQVFPTICMWEPGHRLSLTGWRKW